MGEIRQAVSCRVRGAGGGWLERQAYVQVSKSLEDQGPWWCERGCMLGNRYLVMCRLVGGKMEKVRKAV